jgi:hypothetical protein
MISSLSSQERVMANSSKRRKKSLLVLGLLAWLLLLGFGSYFLFLPNLDDVSQQLRAIREDPNLTPLEIIEKSREIYSKLTPQQGRRVFENDFKKMAHQRNREMQEFLKMSPEEQVAYLKKQAEEGKKPGQKDGFAVVKDAGVLKPGSGGPGGGAGMPGGGMVKAVGGGPGGGRFVFYGPAGGGLLKPEQMQKTMLDNFSPETRAGQFYQKGLLSK